MVCTCSRQEIHQKVFLSSSPSFTWSPASEKGMAGVSFHHQYLPVSSSTLPRHHLVMVEMNATAATVLQAVIPSMSGGSRWNHPNSGRWHFRQEREINNYNQQNLSNIKIIWKVKNVWLVFKVRGSPPFKNEDGWKVGGDTEVEAYTIVNDWGKTELLGIYSKSPSWGRGERAEEWPRRLKRQQ